VYENLHAYYTRTERALARAQESRHRPELRERERGETKGEKDLRKSKAQVNKALEHSAKVSQLLYYGVKKTSFNSKRPLEE